MKSLLIKHRTNLSGFTLVELVVSMGVVGVVGVVMFSVLISTMKLSSVNTATNMSNYRTRQALDRLASHVHYDGMDIPVQINADGSTIASGTTSDGIVIKHFLGAGYSFINSDGSTKDISKGTSKFDIQYATAGDGTLPQDYDYFLVASSTAPELQVAAGGVSSPTTAGGITTVTVQMAQSTTETLTPSAFKVTAVRYRKEAYIFVQNGTSSYWTLRYYKMVYPGMSYSDPGKYFVLGTGFQKQGTQAWFTNTPDSTNNTQAIWLHALVRSSGHNEYAEHIDGRNTQTTMPLQIKLWSYTAPPTSN